MPFDSVETHTKENMPPTALISYMKPKARGSKNGKPAASQGDRRPSLTISIPTTICGVSKSERFELQIGTGADAGKLRIVGNGRRAPDGPEAVVMELGREKGVKPHELANCFKFNFGYVPRLGDEIFDGERRPVKKISDDIFEIAIPASWFKAAR